MDAPAHGQLRVLEAWHRIHLSTKEFIRSQRGIEQMNLAPMRKQSFSQIQNMASGPLGGSFRDQQHAQPSAKRRRAHFASALKYCRIFPLQSIFSLIERAA